METAIHTTIVSAPNQNTLSSVFCASGGDTPCFKCTVCQRRLEGKEMRRCLRAGCLNRFCGPCSVKFECFACGAPIRDICFLHFKRHFDCGRYYHDACLETSHQCQSCKEPIYPCCQTRCSYAECSRGPRVLNLPSDDDEEEQFSSDGEAPNGCV